jgi:hypothetical protein
MDHRFFRRRESALYALSIIPKAVVFASALILLCQCDQRPHVMAPSPSPSPESTEKPLESSVATPPLTPVPSVTATPVPSVTATPVPSVTATPVPSVTATPVPSVTATAAPSVAATPVPGVTATPSAPQATPDPQSLEEGIKRILASSQSGFADLRGKFKRTENGMGESPLFRVRKLYEGAFLCGGSIAAELEEIYFRRDGRPSYNYRLFFQSASPGESGTKYDDLMVRLQQLLTGFQHTHASGYDAWVRSDTANTAVLLSVQQQSELLQLQVHVAFPAPKW